MTPEFEKAFNLHRDERAQELFDMAEILNTEGFTPDTGPIVRAAAQCRAPVRTARVGQPDAGRQYWGFEIADLRINLEDQKHVRPRSAVMRAVSGTLSVAVEEYIPDQESQIGQSYKYLRRLDTDFFFDVFHDVNGIEEPLRAAWHLDTHLYTATASRTSHPRFHFQFGGERFDAIDEHIRGVLMSEAPRMPCAPFDAILAVDFILAHYSGEKWSLLKALVPSYLRLRKNPMQRYWLPYFRTLAEGVENLDTIPGGGDACTLNPNIFCG